ncbi:proline dehydrogenase [Paenibacillus sp. LMG 31456]|uniref:proline dehydrogenase n=1 Tax=Paenibacillus foliorum TaxID=2654974 RepID=A0A972GUK4_9BACL|nr:proline dehydrogenase family protein [Paenibacillus foliorum]NOU94488.1 proline dehydrogenase [Paenibacillus foliorum]
MKDRLLRKSVLTIAEFAPVRWLFLKYGMKLGVDRFVAAETLPETLEKVRGLNEEGMHVTLDYLGENVLDSGQAEETAAIISSLFPAIQQLRLQANVSVKLTQLGLRIDRASCLKHMERIVSEAAVSRSFVRIDMEDSTVTQETIDVFRLLLRRFGPGRIGLVLQSYLYRSEQDADQLGAGGTNLRIVKGAYRESPDVAFPDKRDVDAAYTRIVKAHLTKGGYAAVATHDPEIIDTIIRFSKDKGIPRGRFEFQMLYGIAGDLQRDLVRAGYLVRIYTPFGRLWYPYFTRRIAERPANLWFVAKHMLRP